jgi:hypothetical protein
MSLEVVYKNNDGFALIWPFVVSPQKEVGTSRIIPTSEHRYKWEDYPGSSPGLVKQVRFSYLSRSEGVA